MVNGIGYLGPNGLRWTDALHGYGVQRSLSPQRRLQLTPRGLPATVSDDGVVIQFAATLGRHSLLGAYERKS